MKKGPLLSCENNLKICLHTTQSVSVQVSSIYIEQVELTCEHAPSSLLEFVDCCGNKIRVKSKDLTALSLRATKYVKVITNCPRLRNFRIEGVKVLKRLLLDSTSLCDLQLGHCQVKSITCDTTIMPNTPRLRPTNSRSQLINSNSETATVDT